MGADGHGERLAELRERLAAKLIDGDVLGARVVVTEARNRMPVASLYLDLLVPVLHEIGARWEHREIGVAEEHLATSVSEVVIADLSAELPRAPRCWRTAIVACAPGELHALGSRVVADFLEAAGWDVLHLGAVTPADALAELAVSRDVNVVALSAATAERIPELTAAIERLRSLPFPPLVVVGGQAVEDAEAAARIGADLHADSPDRLVRVLGERFAA